MSHAEPDQNQRACPVLWDWTPLLCFSQLSSSGEAPAEVQSTVCALLEPVRVRCSSLQQKSPGQQHSTEQPGQLCNPTLGAG